jgi:hypothetical protein
MPPREIAGVKNGEFVNQRGAHPQMGGALAFGDKRLLAVFQLLVVHVRRYAVVR